MTRFGGNEFIGFSVPLVFAGRYFLLEPGEPSTLSAFIEIGGRPIFEVLKNEPVSNLHSDTTKSATGIVTVADKATGRFLYKVRPGSETSIVFGALEAPHTTVLIRDGFIRAGGVTVGDCVFSGFQAGILVEEGGGIAIGATLPPAVLAILSGRGQGN
ncbi:hypothetical protein JW848_11265 [Candidatus Bipolaricaulota bacterium]|nr:hypothetical protein [Candidatus Bipolaricaulota bacterium]